VIIGTAETRLKKRYHSGVERTVETRAVEIGGIVTE
jgi:hypothetical protein